MVVIGICDADPQLDKEIRSNLEKLFFQVTDIEVTAFSSCTEMLSQMKTASFVPDLILYDINMSDGVETAVYVKEYMQSTSVIAYTDTDRYVFAGYAYGLYSYVMKTPGHDDLLAEIKRYIKEKLSSQAEFLSIRSGGCIQHVRLNRVQYFESRGRKISAVTVDENFEFYQKMDVLCGVLPMSEFIRCHQSYVVNVQMIRSYSTNAITLKSGFDIPVSRKYLSDIKERIIQPNIT